MSIKEKDCGYSKHKTTPISKKNRKYIYYSCLLMIATASYRELIITKRKSNIKVVQKLNYNRLFCQSYFIKLTVGDGTIASIQLQFQLAVVPERRLSQCSFFCTKHTTQLCMSPSYKI
jgi:hypothetical protein